MMKRAIDTVLAFAIRYRVSPTGRAVHAPRLSVVDGRATPETSAILKLPSMAKVKAEIDNYFIPAPPPEGSLFCVVFGVVVVALISSALALFHTIGGQ